jgi:hypothetical protein
MRGHNTLRSDQLQAKKQNQGLASCLPRAARRPEQHLHPPPALCAPCVLYCKNRSPGETAFALIQSGMQGSKGPLKPLDDEDTHPCLQSLLMDACARAEEHSRQPPSTDGRSGGSSTATCQPATCRPPPVSAAPGLSRHHLKRVRRLSQRSPVHADNWPDDWGRVGRQMHARAVHAADCQANRAAYRPTCWRRGHATASTRQGATIADNWILLIMCAPSLSLVLPSPSVHRAVSRRHAECEVVHTIAFAACHQEPQGFEVPMNSGASCCHHH